MTKRELIDRMLDDYEEGIRYVTRSKPMHLVEAISDILDDVDDGDLLYYPCDVNGTVIRPAAAPTPTPRVMKRWTEEPPKEAGWYHVAFWGEIEPRTCYISEEDIDDNRKSFKVTHWLEVEPLVLPGMLSRRQQNKNQ